MTSSSSGLGGGSRTTSTSTGTANGGASTASTGNGFGGGIFTTVGTGGDSGSMCSAYKSCSDQGVTCGTAPDGCGDILNCGSCASGQTCTAGGDGGASCVQTCSPTTCQALGYNCGMASDGCSGVLDCGSSCPTGQTCGGSGKSNQCGTGICTPTTCAALGDTCGSQGDGCGGTLNCGTCSANEACTGGTCKTTCTPTTCATIGATCGPQSDGCGGTLDCGTCPSGQGCSGLPSTCNNTVACTGLCKQQVTCSSGQTTSISGTIFAPNGTDVLPGALVYVPNSALSTFQDGVATPHCACADDVSGTPLVSAVTNFDGTFSITNMPVGANIPLVIQKGRWRRVYTIPNVAQCVNTALPTAAGTTQPRLPQKEAEFGPYDNIPLMGFSTGAVDSLECVLRKIGIADTQFSDPSGTGRVRFYKGNGVAGAQYSKSTPSETTLWGTQAEINAYDIVYFACQGEPVDRTAAQQAILVNYANAGGRVFTTHYHYTWITNDNNTATWSPTAAWSDEDDAFTNDPETGLINTASTDPRPTTLAKWLQFIKASTTYGQMQVGTLRSNFTSVASTSLLWMSITDSAFANQPGYSNSSVPMHYTFDTPINTPAANQCGRVLFSDFHVEDAEDNPTTGVTFPKECTSATMTPQEKLLEYMIFDLGSCVTPLNVCTPSTCSAQNISCGEAADGCGNILSCGACPSGESCVAGTCKNTCTPQTCSGQGYTCGMQSDGCGNAINCGSCPSGVCSAGSCTAGTCTPATACPAGENCGIISDGCSGTINCGTCTAPQTCGGGGTPNQCGAPQCTPKTCAQQGFNCGNATDGCGNTINCGTCVAPQSCGGGSPGVGNVCGGVQGT